MGYLLLGSVDSYGDVIVSKLDTNGKGTHFIFRIYFGAKLLCFCHLVIRLCSNQNSIKHKSDLVLNEVFHDNTYKEAKFHEYYLLEL